MENPMFTSEVTPDTYSYYDALRQTEPMERFGNVDLLTDPNTGKEIQICHLVGLSVFNFLDGAALDWTYLGASSIEMAIHHFNTGDGSVVPAFQDIHKRCPIRLTSEWLDTRASAFSALRTLTDIVTRTSNKPCAILGATYSSVSLLTSTLSSVHGYPQISWVSASSDLNVRDPRPLFSRTMVSTDSFGRAAIQLLNTQLNYQHITVLYLNDNFGNAYLRSFVGLASRLGINTRLVPFDDGMSPEEARDVIAEVKKGGYRCIFVILTTSGQLEVLLKEGYVQGVVGPDYFWLAGNDVIPSIGLSYPKGSELDQAFQGVAQLELSSGRAGQYNYDALQDEWKSLSQENLEYFDSKYKFNYETNNSLFDWVQPGDENSEAIFAYDALAALAMAACNVSINVAPLEGAFLGSHHADSIINGKPFHGSYGVVAFDPETATRRGTSVEFIVRNVLRSTTSTGERSTTSRFDVPTSTILDPNSEGTGWNPLLVEPFVYFDGSTNAPPDLPPLNGGSGEEFNYIGNFRAMGYVLFAISLSASLSSGLWMYRNRAVRVVRVSQPIFLAMILSGTAIMAASIIPRGVDDEHSSTQACNVACMAFPWLLSTGFATVFSALFSKTLRINKILNGSSSFSRIKVEAKDVMLPFAILMFLNIVVLTCWTAIAPLKWIRTDGTGIDSFNRVLESVGECTSDDDGPGSSPFVISLLIINISAVLGANYQAYKARNIQTDFSESKYIAITMLCILEIFIIGIPLYILIDDDPQTSYVLDILIVFITSVAVSGVIFSPKIWFARQHQLEQIEKDKEREERRESAAVAMASYESDRSNHSSQDQEDGEGMGVYLAPSVYKKSGLVRASESSKASVVPKPAIEAPRISEDSQQARRPPVVKWKSGDVSEFGEA